MTFDRVLVAGAGQMGAGIAQVVAASGRKVLLYDSVPGAVDRGVDVDLSPHRPLDVLVDEELVDAPRADRRGPFRGHAADECDVDLGEALV